MYSSYEKRNVKNEKKKRAQAGVPAITSIIMRFQGKDQTRTFFQLG